MKLVVTGAHGYIGRRFVALALHHGHEVIVASRRRQGNCAWLPFDLADPERLALPAGTGSVIHLAAQTGGSGGMDERTEIVAAQSLIATATAIGSRLIFVSSQAAQADAPTAYGRVKWQIEQRVVAAGGIAVRPGQVYGGDERGLFGTLAGMTRRLPVLPAFIPAPPIQPIHVDDLALALLRLAHADVALPGIVQLGAEQPVTFTRFLRQLAAKRIRRPRLFVPVPVAALAVCRRLVGARAWQRTGLDRLDSLFALRTMSTAADLTRLQLVLRPLSSGMHRSGDDRRRNLLLEGQWLLRYVLKRPPGSALLRRYARATTALRGNFPLRLPWWIAPWPGMLALLDDPQRSATRTPELSARLGIALMLAEASREGARRFLPESFCGSRLFGLFVVGTAVGSEAIWRMLRWAYAAFTPAAPSNREVRP